MKFAILHLSDFHLKKENSSWIIDRAHQVANAVKLSLTDCKRIYVVVSGDIANSGLVEEYEFAETFFSRLKSSLLSNITGEISIKEHLICVPGNHDVCLKDENKVQDVLRKSVVESYPEVDDSIYDAIVKSQSHYTEFIKRINEDPDYKPSLLTSFKDKIDKFQIRFDLYNTAWMFSLKDPKGSIYMPIDRASREIDNKESDLVVSVMHHYFDWLSDSKQNKTKFTRHIADSSNILLYGHEHEFVSIGKSDNFSKGFISEYEGAAFYSKDEKGAVNSQFEVLVIDTEQSSCLQTTFCYYPKDSIYRCLQSKSHNISTEFKAGVFRHNIDYLQSLDEMPTPIYNFENEKFKLGTVRKTV